MSMAKAHLFSLGHNLLGADDVPNPVIMGLTKVAGCDIILIAFL